MKTYRGHAFCIFLCRIYGSVGSAHHRSPPCCLQQPRGILWGLELSLLGAQEHWRASAPWRNGNLQEGRGQASLGPGGSWCCIAAVLLPSGDNMQLLNSASNLEVPVSPCLAVW